MLWMPPSQTYLRPQGPYASFQAQTMTKKLVFSPWSATPTSVASLLSFEASRNIAATQSASQTKVSPSSENVSQRLQFRRTSGDLSAMTSFMLFFPLPDLADQADPLSAAATAGTPVDRDATERSIAQRLDDLLPDGRQESAAAEALSLLWQCR